jgi:NAD(P) transhydrogenase
MRSKSAASGISTGSMQRAQGTWKLPAKSAPEADVGDDIFGAAVLVDHFGAAGGGQIADLLGFVAEIDGAGSLSSRSNSINTGTIPSKTMREAVLHLSGYNYRSIYGVNYRVKEKITMADLAFRVQAVIKTEVDVTEAQLSRNGIDVVHGIASFVDPHQVRVEGAADGRRPRGRPDHHRRGHQAGRVRQSAGQRQDHHQQRPDSGPGGAAQDADRGGRRRDRRGVCCMFAVLGVRVTLIEKRNRLLEFADQEIVEALSYHLRDSA